ncbi:hypothetical protein QAD02_003635 [Eretmocerus hayati]|uniref:Uncharacterized protein n=1 Tax=Eretmocerus hayati TaxID=131215 RepID=A0ACC2NN94_9HYME|nr:hypothetical protein QAD02_003635 [Eretmocerus hayati]
MEKKTLINVIMCVLRYALSRDLYLETMCGVTWRTGLGLIESDALQKKLRFLFMHCSYQTLNTLYQRGVFAQPGVRSILYDVLKKKFGTFEAFKPLVGFFEDCRASEHNETDEPLSSTLDRTTDAELFDNNQPSTSGLSTSIQTDSDTTRPLVLMEASSDAHTSKSTDAIDAETRDVIPPTWRGTTAAQSLVDHAMPSTSGLDTSAHLPSDNIQPLISSGESNNEHPSESTDTASETAETGDHSVDPSSLGHGVNLSPDDDEPSEPVIPGAGGGDTSDTDSEFSVWARSEPSLHN